MRVTRAMLATLIVLTLGACAPYVHFTALNGPMPPRKGLDAVAVSNTHVPDCPYTELGIVTAYGGTQKVALEAVKRKALAVGGDAILAIQAVNSGGDLPRQGYSATVIRFDKADCRH